MAALANLTAMDCGNAKGLQEQSLAVLRGTCTSLCNSFRRVDGYGRALGRQVIPGWRAHGLGSDTTSDWIRTYALRARAKPGVRRRLQVPGLKVDSDSSAKIAPAMPVRRLRIHRAGRDAGEFCWWAPAR